MGKGNLAYLVPLVSTVPDALNRFKLLFHSSKSRLGDGFSRKRLIVATAFVCCLQGSESFAAGRYTRPHLGAKPEAARAQQVGQPTPSPFAPALPAPAPATPPSLASAGVSANAGGLIGQAPAPGANDLAQSPQLPPRKPRYVWVARPFIPPTPEKIEAEKQKVLANTIAWQKQRADAGSERAAFALGVRYLNGDGVPQDADLGRAYLRKAADAGFALAEKEWRKSFQQEGAPANAIAQAGSAKPDSPAESRQQNP